MKHAAFILSGSEERSHNAPLGRQIAADGSGHHTRHELMTRNIAEGLSTRGSLAAKLAGFFCLFVLNQLCVMPGKKKQTV